MNTDIQADKPVMFCVSVIGYWGKGKTLFDAARQCHKAGAAKRDKCVAYCYVGDRADDITVNGYGDILYHADTVQSIRLFGPNDSKVTIGSLIGK